MNDNTYWDAQRDSNAIGDGARSPGAKARARQIPVIGDRARIEEVRKYVDAVYRNHPSSKLLQACRAALHYFDAQRAEALNISQLGSLVKGTAEALRTALPAFKTSGAYTGLDAILNHGASAASVLNAAAAFNGSASKQNAPMARAMRI